MSDRARRAAVLRVLFGVGAAACAGAHAPERAGTDYVAWVAVDVPIHESVLVHWPVEKMPLRVHLPRPPKGLFPEPDAIYDSVREGVTDWSDVAAPGVPRFAFVDVAGDADIDVSWESKPTGAWYVAYCQPSLDLMARRFVGPAHVLVTGRWQDGRLADIHDVYAVVLHEMGHALGLLGHSPDPGDIMYPSVPGQAVAGLSTRDRNTLRLVYEKPVGTRVPGAHRESTSSY